MQKILLFLVLTAAPLWGQVATVSQFPVSGEDFLRQAELIFVGEVVDRESFRDGGFIMTRYDFRVFDRLKGNPGAIVRLTEYGGTIGEEALWVSHNPEYREGEQYVVFSYRDSRQRNRTFAGPLGRLHVTSTPQGERRVRIFRSHPLIEVLKDGRLPSLMELNSFAGRLQNSMREMAR